MKKQILTIAAVVIAVFGLSFLAKSIAKNENSINSLTITESTMNNSEGKELLESKCMACHKVQNSRTAMLAPPIAYIKKRYSTAYSSKEGFVEAFANFAANPQEDKAIMFGAVKQFKLMPNMGYKKSDMEKIALYIYDNDFPKPAWHNK